MRLAFPWEPELIGDPYACYGGGDGGGGDDGGGSTGGTGGSTDGSEEGGSVEGGGTDEGGAAAESSGTESGFGGFGGSASGFGAGTESSSGFAAGAVEGAGFGGSTESGFGGTESGLGGFGGSSLGGSAASEAAGGFGGSQEGQSGFGGVESGFSGFGQGTVDASTAIGALEALGQTAMSSIQDTPGMTQGFSALEQGTPSGHVGQGFADLAGSPFGTMGTFAGLSTNLGQSTFEQAQQQAQSPTAPEPLGPVEAPTQQAFEPSAPTQQAQEAINQGFSAINAPSPSQQVEQAFTSLIGPPSPFSTPSFLSGKDIENIEQAFNPNVDPAAVTGTLAGLPSSMVGPSPFGIGTFGLTQGTPGRGTQEAMQGHTEFESTPSQAIEALNPGTPTSIGRSPAFAPPGIAIDVTQPGFLEPGPAIGLTASPFGVNPAQGVLANTNLGMPGFPGIASLPSTPTQQSPLASIATQNPETGLPSMQSLSPSISFTNPSPAPSPIELSQINVVAPSPQNPVATSILGLPEIASRAPVATSLMGLPDVEEVAQTTPQAQVGRSPVATSVLGLPSVEEVAQALTAPSITSQLAFDPTQIAQQAPPSLAQISTFADRFGTQPEHMSPFDPTAVAPAPIAGRAPSKGFFDQTPGQFEPDFDRSAPPGPPSPPPAPSPPTFAFAPTPQGLPPGVIDPFGSDLFRRIMMAQQMGLM